MYGEMAEDPSKSKIKGQIDQNLKRVYDDALNAEVPDRFKQLLAQLKAREDEARDAKAAEDDAAEKADKTGGKS